MKFKVGDVCEVVRAKGFAANSALYGQLVTISGERFMSIFALPAYPVDGGFVHEATLKLINPPGNTTG